MTALRTIQLRGPLSSAAGQPRIPLRSWAPSPSRRNNSSTSNGGASTSTPTRPCPSCSTPLPLPASPCPSCSKLVPIPTGLSHHSLFYLSQPVLASAAFSATFDLPAELSTLPAHGYDLDVKDLRSKMLRRQMELHPDKYSGKDDEVRLARELSGRVNGAYETLRDPLRRAEYLLSTHELAVAETESLTDPALLAEILEAREELDMATLAEEVDEIRQTNSAKVQQTIASIKDAFSEDPPNLTGAKVLAVQLKYWQGLEDAAREWTPKA